MLYIWQIFKKKVNINKSQTHIIEIRKLTKEIIVSISVKSWDLRDIRMKVIEGDEITSPRLYGINLTAFFDS